MRDTPPDPADDDPWFRPVWADLADETEDTPAWPAVPARTADPALLAALAAAQDALARLDTRAALAPAPIRTGLIARLALHEAGGWLATRDAWVHPLDLALRAHNLTGRFDTAAHSGRASRAMPNSRPGRAPAWSRPADLAALAAGEQAVTAALALTRLLGHLPRQHDPLADPAAAAPWLDPLGSRVLDPARFAAWRAQADATSDRSEAALPPLLAAAQAATDWMSAGVTDPPDPLVALAMAALRLARPSTPLRVIPLPFWAAWPALGHGAPGALPRLRARPDAAWAVVFLILAAEAARAGTRLLDQLHTTAATGAALTQGQDRRARLADALDAVLAIPVLTPQALAHQLAITPQAASRLLASLAAAGVIREVTGRASFRAFAA